MSEQGRAYRFDRHERAVTLRGLQEMRRIFVRRSEPEGVAQCDAAIASLSHPVPTAQEMLIAILQHVGVAVGHGDEADFRAAVMAVAAEMGLTIDEEQGDA